MGCGCAKKAVNLVRTGARVATALVADPKVDQELKGRRMRLCERCELFRLSLFNVPFCGAPYDGDDERDTQKEGCGCCLIAKVWLKSESCPRGAW